MAVGRRSVCAGLALAASGQRSAGARPLPITLVGTGLPFVPVAVDDGAVVGLLDTGSSRALQLSTALARRLGMRLTESGRTTRRHDGVARQVLTGSVGAIAIGPWRGNAVDVDVVADDIETIGARIGVVFDMIIGWEFLSRFVFAVDARTESAQLDLDASADTSDRRVRLLVDSAPVVGAEIDGRSVRMLIDSGAPHCLIDTGLAQPFRGQQRHVLLGGRLIEQRFRDRDLATLRRALGASGVLGWEFFVGRRLVFDRVRANVAIG